MERAHDEEFVAFASSSLPALRRTAYLMCGDWHRAEDAAQEALIRIYGSWRRIERQEGVLAYARRTVVRILIDDSRRPFRREVVTDRLPEWAVDTVDPVDQRDEMLRALALLSPRRRACVVLRYYADLSVAETARALGCSEGNVKRMTSDALAGLRGILDGPAADPTWRTT